VRAGYAAQTHAPSCFNDHRLCAQVTQLKRTTEAGIQTGFVLFVDGQVLKMPENELARDCVMPEGPPDDMKIICALLTAIPRDGDNNSELWTTVDQNKTNVRSKAVSKLIQVMQMLAFLQSAVSRTA
jgi:hypothetical protein